MASDNKTTTAAGTERAVEAANEDLAWDALVRAAVQWAEHMDQWDKFQFDTKFGAVYVSVTRQTPWPDDFNKLPNTLARTAADGEDSNHPVITRETPDAAVLAAGVEREDAGHALKALEALIDLAAKTYYLCDDSEDRNEEHMVTHEDFMEVCAALDTLDELPDDQPGYTMGPVAKASWSLRNVLATLRDKAANSAGVLAGGAIPCSLCQGPTICRDAGQCALSATMEDVCGGDELTLEDRIAALERRPEWTEAKESLLRMISNSVWFLLREKSTAHTIHAAIEAAFPEART